MKYCAGDCAGDKVMAEIGLYSHQLIFGQCEPATATKKS